MLDFYIITKSTTQILDFYKGAVSLRRGVDSGLVPLARHRHGRHHLPPGRGEESESVSVCEGVRVSGCVGVSVCACVRECGECVSVCARARVCLCVRV